MKTSRVLSIAAAGALVTAVACGDKQSSLAPSPLQSGARGAAANAAEDGSTLKATAPAPQSPVGGVRVDSFTPLLIVGNATALHTEASFFYEFELYSGEARIAVSPPVPGGAGTTSWQVPSNLLDTDQPYGWRARAVLDSAHGPWSPMASFLSLDQPEGYIAGDELYDPLINGKTIGRIVGPVTFIPGVGARLEHFTSHIEYLMPIPNGGAGELSMRVRNVIYNTPGGKTKIMSMRMGDSDITTNEYRVTIEKRGDPPGTIAWRFRYGNDEEVDTIGQERRPHTFNPALEYLWQARWFPGRFDLEIFEGGPFGQRVYSFGKSFSGAYRPHHDHRVYVGAPPGRAGELDASVPGIIVSHVWMSSRPRPAFANR
jgi:hypothetical protein